MIRPCQVNYVLYNDHRKTQHHQCDDRRDMYVARIVFEIIRIHSSNRQCIKKSLEPNNFLKLNKMKLHTGQFNSAT